MKTVNIPKKLRDKYDNIFKTVSKNVVKFKQGTTQWVEAPAGMGKSTLCDSLGKDKLVDADKFGLNVALVGKDNKAYQRTWIVPKSTVEFLINRGVALTGTATNISKPLDCYMIDSFDKPKDLLPWRYESILDANIKSTKLVRSMDYDQFMLMLYHYDVNHAHIGWFDNSSYIVAEDTIYSVGSGVVKKTGRGVDERKKHTTYQDEKLAGLWLDSDGDVAVNWV